MADTIPTQVVDKAAVDRCLARVCKRIGERGIEMPTSCRAIGTTLLTLVLLLSAAGAGAQTPAAPPAGMTPEQFNALVDAISNSVTEKLKAEGVHDAPAAPPAAAPAAPAASSSKSKAKPPPPSIIRTPIPEGPGPFAVFIDHAGNVVRAVPTLGAKLGSIPGLLDQSAAGGRSTSIFLLLLGLVAAAALAAEAVLRAFMARFRHRLAGNAVPEQGLRSLANLAALAVLDGLGVLAVWLICNAAIGAWFTGATGQDKLAAAILDGIFYWRLYVLLFLIILRPALPQARLCEVADPDARSMYARIELVMLMIILGRILGHVLMAIHTPVAALGAYQVIVTVIYVSTFIWLVRSSRDAAAQWLGGLGKVAPLAGVVGRNWVPAATTFFLILGLTQVYGAVSGLMHVGQAMLLTLILVVGVLMFETLMQAFVRRLDSQLDRRHAGQRFAQAARRRGALRARGRADRRRGHDRRAGWSRSWRWSTRPNGTRSRARPAPCWLPRCSWPTSCGRFSSTRPIPTWRARTRAPPKRSPTATPRRRRPRASAP